MSSLSARERRNPPPRKKSCAACIRAKRRCDLATPSCLRCEQRCIPCEYPAGSTKNARPAARTASVAARRGYAAVQPEQMKLDELLVDEFAGVFGGDDCALGTGSAYSHVFDAAFGVQDPSALDFVDNCFSDPVVIDNRPEEPVKEMIQKHPVLLAAPATKELEERFTQIIAQRLQYSIDEIVKAPQTMLLQSETPWSHPMLYADSMPRSMQDAHASCALYLAKNRANAPIIFRSIESHVGDLLAAPMPMELLDSLAHTQSLILYQIIRLFDGNISARASAERTIPALETSAINLLSHIDYNTKDTYDSADMPLLQQHSLLSTPATKVFWASWVLQESARRTLLFTFFFLQAYRLLRSTADMKCDGRLGLCHWWTGSAHLWHARTAAGFGDAWRRRNHFVVRDGRFEMVLRHARADDVDVFGRMLVSAMIGVEDMERWLNVRGGSLRGDAAVCES